MNILVTGASRGIGNAIFKELKLLGNVYVTGRNEETLSMLEADGYKVCDLSDNIDDLCEFIKDIKPDIAIISCGYQNRYGHPHKEVVERLEMVGSEIMSTVEAGAITIKIGKKIEVDKFHQTAIAVHWFRVSD